MFGLKKVTKIAGGSMTPKTINKFNKAFKINNILVRIKA